MGMNLPFDDPVPPVEKEQPVQNLFERIIEEVYRPLEKRAEEFAGLIGQDGKFTDSDKARDMLREAFYSGGGTFNKFEKLVNEKLRDSGMKVVFDDSLAKIQDIGYVYCAVLDRNGNRSDGVGFSVNNSPRVPEPIPLPGRERQPEKLPEIPSDWPRLDIIDLPSRKR